jgi:hypothetical protein
MELISHSSTYCQTRVGSYGYVPSCQVPKVAASQGPEWVMLIRCGKPSDMLDQAPRSLPRVDERGGRGKQVVKSCLPTLIVGWRTDDHGLFLGLVFLGWWPLLFNLEWWGHFLVRGVWFSSCLLLKGIDCIHNFGP